VASGHVLDGTHSSEEVRVAKTDAERHFDSLFTEHIVGIASYCRWRAGSPADAQDAVSEVFLVAWRRLDEVPSGSDARRWLYATARRVMANQARANARRRRLPETLDAEGVGVHPVDEDPLGRGSWTRFRLWARVTEKCFCWPSGRA
jgi:DNA-directed RNA polymerase specialized sigma24 family protein